jgi:pyrimidine-nucleoside phosphorylase
MELTLELAARMAVLGGKAKDPAGGRALCEETLKSGKPRRLFLDNIRSQGGDPERFLAMRGVYRSEVKGEVRAREGGFIRRIDALKVGHAGVQLGVGRNRTEDAVSPTAGVQFHKKSGAALKAGDLIMSVWARDKDGLAAALPQLEDAVSYSAVPPEPRRLILKCIESQDPRSPEDPL